MGSLRFADVQTRPTEVLDLTSLTIDEFQRLVPPFEGAFQAHMAEWRLDGQPRTARRYTTYQNCPLPMPEDRLQFIPHSIGLRPGMSEDTVIVCQGVFLPPCIMWIKGLVFFYDRPRDMEQFPSGGTPSDFLWLPGRAQPAIEGLDDGVMLRRTQRLHIQRGPEAAVASTNLVTIKHQLDEQPCGVAA